MLNPTFNSGHFSADLLCQFLKCSLHCVDFNTDGLLRDLKCSFADPEPKMFDNFLKEVTRMTLSGMSFKKTTTLEDAGITYSHLKKELKYNSDDWSKLVKYCFENTILINRTNPKVIENWQHFVKEIRSMIAESYSYKGKLNPAFGDIAGKFKRFIGQLIKDDEAFAAEAIHLMIQFAINVASHYKKNKMSRLAVGKMMSMVFFKGLEFHTIVAQKQIMGEANQLSFGLKIMFSNEFFKVDFSKKLYADYQQSYALNFTELSQVLPNDTMNIDQGQKGGVLISYNQMKMKAKQDKEKNDEVISEEKTSKLKKSSSSSS